MRRQWTLGLLTAVAAAARCSNNAEGVKIATLAVAPDTVRLARGDSVFLTVSPLDAAGHLVSGVAITFVAADTTIVRVSNTGVVRAVAVGTTKVTVSGGGVRQDVPTTVFAIAASVTVAPADTSVRQGDSYTLRATVYDAQHVVIPGAAVTFNSLDTTIARVSPSGVVRAVGVGTVQLSASSGSAVGVANLSARDSSIVARTLLDGSPFGAAAAHQGAAYVLRHTLNLVSRFNLPDTTVVTSFGIAAEPTSVAFDSAGTTAYITSQFGQRVLVVTAASNTVVDSIPTTGDADIVRVSPDDQSIWVSTTADSLYQIDRASKTVLARYGLPLVPNGIAFSPVNDSLLYVTTQTAGVVVEINYKRQAFGRTFSPGGTTQAVAVSVDGNELYVSNESLDEIEIYDLGSGAPLTPIPTGGPAFDLTLSADGTALWVSLSGSGEVQVYDRASRALRHDFRTGGTPRRIAVTPATNFVVVANEAGWVDFLK